MVVLVAAGSADDAPGARDRALEAAAARPDRRGNPTARIVSFRHDGHNLMRYRPDAVSAAILGVAGRAGD